MKKILTALALVLTAGTALAADLPHYKAPLPPPPPPPPLWTGFYVGLNAGGTWANNNSVYVTNWPVGGTFSILNLLLSGSQSVNNGAGFIGGGQIGYNWQFYNGRLVAGVEADIQGIAGLRGRRNYLTAAPLLTVNIGDGIIFSINSLSNVYVRKSLDYLGTVRGRVGWLFTPTLLVYGTGGLAYGGVNVSLSNFQGIFLGAPFGGLPAGTFLSLSGGTGSFSDTRVGWTAGGGIEWMFMPNWSAKAEYLYYDLGTVTGSVVNINFLAPAVVSVSQFSTRFNGNIVRAGVNYHFNWSAPPVVAKY